MGDGADQYLFDFRHVLSNVAIAFAEVQDRVPDDLAGTVIRDVAAARRLEESDAIRAQDVRRCEQVRRVTSAA